MCIRDSFYSVNEPTLHALYFSRSEEQDKTVGCVGHLRGDFGSGKQFYTTWWPPVSYTHLDVYKRQRSTRVSLDSIFTVKSFSAAVCSLPSASVKA